MKSDETGLRLLGFVLALAKYGFGVGSCTSRVVSLRNSIAPWHSLCAYLFVGSLTRRRGESSAEDCLTLFKNNQEALVLPVVTTSPLTVRRRWKKMTQDCVLLGFLLALVKQGFGVGSCTDRLVSVRYSISRTPWHSLCRCLLFGS